jgi:hypothetical protein
MPHVFFQFDGWLGADFSRFHTRPERLGYTSRPSGRPHEPLVCWLVPRLGPCPKYGTVLYCTWDTVCSVWFCAPLLQSGQQGVFGWPLVSVQYCVGLPCSHLQSHISSRDTDTKGSLPQAGSWGPCISSAGSVDWYIPCLLDATQQQHMLAWHVCQHAAPVQPLCDVAVLLTA